MSKKGNDRGVGAGHRTIVLFSVLFGIISLFSVSASAVSGREVFEKVNEVRKAGLTRKSDAIMTLFDKTGERSRTLAGYSKKGEGEAYKGLVFFEAPAELKGVGFLVAAHSFSDRDMWAYFPEFKRVRKIPTTSQDDSFFGSDFSYDDFGGPPSLDDYRFDLVREEEIEGQPCFMIEVVPKVRRGFTKYTAWVGKEWSILLKIEYYREKELYKVGTFKDVRIIDQIPTPFFMEMENKKSGHRTDIRLKEIKYNIDLPDSLFTQKSLERGGE